MSGTIGSSNTSVQKFSIEYSGFFTLEICQEKSEGEDLRLVQVTQMEFVSHHSTGRVDSQEHNLSHFYNFNCLQIIILQDLLKYDTVLALHL